MTLGLWHNKWWCITIGNGLPVWESLTREGTSPVRFFSERRVTDSRAQQQAAMVLCHGEVWWRGHNAHTSMVFGGRNMQWWRAMRRGEDVSLAYFIGTDGRAKGREGASSIDSVAQWKKRLAAEWRGEEEGRTWTLLHSREANRRWATLEPTAVAALPNGGGVLLRVVNERGDGLEKNKRLEPTVPGREMEGGVGH